MGRHNTMTLTFVMSINTTRYRDLYRVGLDLQVGLHQGGAQVAAGSKGGIVRRLIGNDAVAH